MVTGAMSRGSDLDLHGGLDPPWRGLLNQNARAKLTSIVGADGLLLGARTVKGVRVALVSAVRLRRDAMQRQLQQADGIELVASTAAADQVSSLDNQLDIVLLDAAPPECFDAAQVLLKTIPGVKVVLIGLEDSNNLAEECARSGICWCFAPQTSMTELVSTLISICSGLTPCSPRIAVALLRGAGRQHRLEPLRLGLTQREAEILNCLREGLMNKEIARRLGIRPATVKNHVHHILVKLHATNRSDAASRPIQRASIPGELINLRRQDSPRG